MINAPEVIKIAMELLPMSEMDDEKYNVFLHDLKNMVIDLQNVKHKVELTIDERLTQIEERMNILLLENAKLKLILDAMVNNNP